MLYTEYKILDIERISEIGIYGSNIISKYLYRVLLDPIPPMTLIYYGATPGYKLTKEKNSKYLIIASDTDWNNIKSLNNPPLDRSCYPIAYFREQLWQELSILDNPNLQIVDWYIASINNLS